jgi:hypothetical protein
MKVATVIRNGRKHWSSVNNGWENLAEPWLKENNGKIIHHKQYPNLVIIVGDYAVVSRQLEAWFIEDRDDDCEYSNPNCNGDRDSFVDLDIMCDGNNPEAPNDLDDLCLYYLTEDPDGLDDDALFSLADSSEEIVHHEETLLARRYEQFYPEVS